MGGAHAVLVEVAAVLLPGALQIARGDGDLIAGGADHGVIGDPVGVGGEEIDAGVDGLSAGGHLFQRSQFLFAAAARIVDLEILVVTDLRKIAGVEEGAVVGELRQFVSVAEAARGVPHREREGKNLPGGERLIERVDGVEIAGSPAHQVERPIELNVRYGLVLVGDVYL